MSSSYQTRLVVAWRDDTIIGYLAEHGIYVSGLGESLREPGHWWYAVRADRAEEARRLLAKRVRRRPWWQRLFAPRNPQIPT
jgi:hypothetical protein